MTSNSPQSEGMIFHGKYLKWSAVIMSMEQNFEHNNLTWACYDDHLKYGSQR